MAAMGIFHPTLQCFCLRRLIILFYELKPLAKTKRVNSPVTIYNSRLSSHRALQSQTPLTLCPLQVKHDTRLKMQKERARKMASNNLARTASLTSFDARRGMFIPVYAKSCMFRFQLQIRHNNEYIIKKSC